MKKQLTTGLIVVLLLAFNACQQTVAPIDKEQEKEAIKTVINTLLDAHARSDSNVWLGQWVQEPYVFISAADSSGYFYHKGYDVIAEGYSGGWPDSLKLDEPENLKLVASNFDIKVADSLARVVFDIDWSFEEPDTIYRWKSFENYSMEKQSDGWKVAAISAVNVSSYGE
ncbi:hypothetical protein [Tamlana flava]|uniref:hypothetical protein n=1 Tax=Tamlana flava TaxID=3158572 RepID=UPI00351B318D